MFGVTVRDHVMVAHSLRGEVFGPSQRLHGATYVVDVTLRGPALDETGVLVDIALASRVVRTILDRIDRRNLDELPEFAGCNSTTEVVARYIADEVAARAAAGDLGPGGARLTGLVVTLHESPVAWASYERSVAGP